MTTASKLSLAVLALTLVGASVAQAQSANITATATVLTPLTVTGAASPRLRQRLPGHCARRSPRPPPTAGRFTHRRAALARRSS